MRMSSNENVIDRRPLKTRFLHISYNYNSTGGYLSRATAFGRFEENKIKDGRAC